MIKWLSILIFSHFSFVSFATDGFFSDLEKFRTDFSYKAANGTKVSGTRLSKTKVNIKSPCLLMLHGFTETKEYFEHFGKFFLENNFNVFMVNLPDHGLSGSRSTSPQGLGGFDDLMDFCKSIISKTYNMCRGRPINIMTHSMGGMSCIDNYLNGGVHKVNGKIVADPEEAKRAARKINRVIAGAPPSEFEINHKRWPVIKLAKRLKMLGTKLSLDNFIPNLVNNTLSIKELKVGSDRIDTSFNMVKDYGMRKSIPLNTTTKGLVSFGALDPGEAVNLETKTNRVGELLINKVTAFFDERAKEYINKTNEDKVFNVQWKDGTQIDYTVKPGQMLIWFKNENDQWLLDVHKAPDYLLNEKYINPFLKEGQISSYRSENGRIIYAGIPANPDVDILYLGAEIDRLADGPLMERKVKNSSSKRVSFVMMKDTDHINLMFGNKSLNILQDTMLSYFKTGLSEETVKLIDNNPHLDLNTNDERYKHTHDKVPRIQVDIESNAPTDICNKDNSLIFLHGILSKLIE